MSVPPDSEHSPAARPSAAPPRVSRMDDSPKGRILSAAAHLFVTRGFAGTTVRDLAAAVGIQSGSLFHHFKSKDEILEAVMVEVIELNTGRMLQALDETAGQDPVAQLHALVRCELRSINGDTRQAMSLLMREWSALSPEAKARVLMLRDRYEQLFLDAIEAAKGGVVEIDPFILRRFLSGIDSNTGYWWNPDGPLSIDQLADLVMKLLLRSA